MLVIVSDLHLTDGTSGRTINEHAFRLFADRVRDMAFDASWRRGSSYRPVERVDILLLGDILDVIRSTRWLGDEQGLRPWSDPADVRFTRKVNEVTDAILKHNAHALSHIGNLARPGGLLLPPPGGANGNPKRSEPGLPIRVGIHYMVGNHDWFYHLTGADYHPLRRKVSDALGLDNDPDAPFPHDQEESARLDGMLRDHGVLARGTSSIPSITPDRGTSRRWGTASSLSW